MRAFWILVHRWVGLVLAGFLLIAGLTGALLAWYHELDQWFAAELYEIPASSRASGLPRLDATTLREQTAARYPSAQLNYVDLRALPERALVFSLNRPTASALTPPSGQTTESSAEDELIDEVFVDPYSSAVLGERQWGVISQGLKNLMPFVYRLHYSLALGSFGIYLFGIVALLWTLDCFIGAYLTLPARQQLGASSWWQRWKAAWQVRCASGSYKLNFDLHRAGGLWLWALLFVIAWSSVAFNLQEVYQPVTKFIFATDERDQQIPKLAEPQIQPGLAWPAALNIARQQMQQEAQGLGVTLFEEHSLSYNPQKALYRYTVRSSADIRDRYAGTRLYLDANSGALKYTSLPTGQYAGDTVTHWLMSLHMAALWGLPFRLVICITGLAVALLSITGVVIWLKKRRARLYSKQRSIKQSTLSPA